MTGSGEADGRITQSSNRIASLQEDVMNERTSERIGTGAGEAGAGPGDSGTRGSGPMSVPLTLDSFTGRSAAYQGKVQWQWRGGITGCIPSQ